MTLKFLYLIGGGLDGVVLPMRHKSPPSQIILFNPEQDRWLFYGDGEEPRETGTIDVYKLRRGVELPTRAPGGSKVYERYYYSDLSQAEARYISQFSEFKLKG